MIIVLYDKIKVVHSDIFANVRGPSLEVFGCAPVPCKRTIYWLGEKHVRNPCSARAC